MENYQIDNLDRGILDALMENARTAYAELADNLALAWNHSRSRRENEAGRDHYGRTD